MQKTGTSSVQALFLGEKSPLLKAGIDNLRSMIAPRNAHHSIAWDLMRRERYREELPGIDALVEQASQSEHDRIFVSSEEFSLLSSGGVETLKERLSSFYVVPIVCVRNQLEWSESMFAQTTKRGFSGTFQDYLEVLDRTRRANLIELVGTWAQQLGVDRTRVLVYEKSRDMCQEIGALLGVTLNAQPPRSNRSLNERFVYASQEVLRGLSDGDKGTVSKKLLALGAKLPQFAGSPVFLEREEAQLYLERFRTCNEELSRIVPLPEQYFVVSQMRRAPRMPSSADIRVLRECVHGQAATTGQDVRPSFVEE